jgi:hypothetical protein
MEVVKMECKIKLMVKREVQFFEWPKGKCKFFYGQKGISPIFIYPSKMEYHMKLFLLVKVTLHVQF